MSYGKGIRAQVFEVVVRQGMAGAPWQDMCAQAMQINNISVEAVQAEIDRRLGDGSGPSRYSEPGPPEPPMGSGPSGSPVPRKPKPPKDSTGAKVGF